MNEGRLFRRKDGKQWFVRARHRCIAKFFSSEEARRGRFLRSNTLSSKRRKMFEEGKANGAKNRPLATTLSSLDTLLWMYASRRALASSQPIIRSHDNADNYFKKRKRRKEKTSIWPTRDQQRHLRRPSAFLFYLPGLLLSRERIKRSLQRTALFSRYIWKQTE